MIFFFFFLAPELLRIYERFSIFNTIYITGFVAIYKSPKTIANLHVMKLQCFNSHSPPPLFILGTHSNHTYRPSAKCVMFIYIHNNMNKKAAIF